MATNTPHTRHSPPQQTRNDPAEQQQPGKAACDGSSRHTDRDRSPQPLFYLELDDNSRQPSLRDDSVTYSTNRFSTTTSNLNDDDSVFGKTVQWTAAGPNSLGLAPALDAGQRDGSDSATAGPTWEGGSSAPRPGPGVQRAISSPSSVSAVCRESHCHLVVRCQVNHHSLPHPPSSCPAAFSPAWTWALPPPLLLPASPSPTKAGSAGTKEKHRRHTVGPASHAAPTRLYQLMHQQHYGRGRSRSDSELQQLLMKEMGRELREMSDHFLSIRMGGGQHLTTVTESSGSSEEDSDDEM